MTIQITSLSGNDILPYLDDVAQLRIQVFRAFPYLYDGSMDYERRYLSTYANSPDSLFVLARDDKRVVGAATAIPMAHETREFKQPFLDHGFDPERIFYFGESVLLPDYRGRGIGVAFFDHREVRARELGGFSHCCFCAVERPEDHPARPANYQPLDHFWRNRGYEAAPGLATHYAWTDVGDRVQTDKPMQFWIRRL